MISESEKAKVKVTQSCPTLHPMDYTVHGILQARILQWVAFPFSRGSSQPKDWTQVSLIAGRFFTKRSPTMISNGGFTIWALQERPISTLKVDR